MSTYTYAVRSLKLSGCTNEGDCGLANKEGCPMTLRPEVFLVTKERESSPGQAQTPLPELALNSQAHVINVISNTGLVVPQGANLVLATPGSEDDLNNSNWKCGVTEGAHGTVMASLDRPHRTQWRTAWQDYLDNAY